MHDRRALSRPWLGAVSGLLLLGAVACTAPQQPKARPAAAAAAPSASPSCASGALRWGSVRQETRLIGLSPAVTAGKHDGWTTFRNATVRVVAARVTTDGADVSGRRVVALLARHLGYDSGDLMPPGQNTAPHMPARERIGSRGAGRIATTEGVKVVDASFVVQCPDGPHYGSLTTWLAPVRSDSIGCGTDPGRDAWLREAYRLACGPLDR
ncbi:hypothetical protein JK359_01385 [Streptomyces actinomycinicus]|uniref:Lipoprotein n=1 Tax=Streptomyces actinomycinicus TaxID=1695166 RepID=A0A937JMP3_9ACTN|nr:hypothetical protein [Streptomyces actinomycinicus]MBL1080638.1 hypothetical protein [Streptomyces actinomycinicus]